MHVLKLLLAATSSLYNLVSCDPEANMAWWPLSPRSGMVVRVVNVQLVTIIPYLVAGKMLGTREHKETAR